MQAPEITLAAALRDVDAKREDARDQAIRNLAPAMLVELSRKAPAWKAASDHARGTEVVAALEGALDDETPAPRRGQAAVALGMIGEPNVIDVAARWLAAPGDAQEVTFLRECAVIALSFVGAAAPAGSHPVRDDCRKRLGEALRSPHPDVRFQAGVALVEVVGREAEDAIVDALRREEQPAVRENLVAALSRLDPPGDRACAALEAILDGDDRHGGVGLQAALALAAARRESARPRLLEALPIRFDRDLALEALAALGPAPEPACSRVEALARSWLLPGITRVRAAYALARMRGETRATDAGRGLLRKLAWHPRKAVREAVADADANLRALTRN